MQRCETRLGRQSVGAGSGAKNHWDFIAAETSRTQPTILPDFFRQTSGGDYREAQTSKEIRAARKQEDAFGIAPLGFLQQASHQSRTHAAVLAVGCDGDRADFNQSVGVGVQRPATQQAPLGFGHNELALVCLYVVKRPGQQRAVPRIDRD